MAFGLRPVRHITGSAWNGNVFTGIIPSSDTNNRFVGDPVILGGTASTLTGYGNPYQDGTFPTLAIAVGTGGSVSTITGVIVGFDPIRGELDKQYGPASTTRVAHVAFASPDVIFQANEDGASDPLELTEIGLACDLIAGSGSTSTGLSGWAIDSSSHDTTGQVQLFGIANTPGNIDLINTSPYPVWEVTVAEPTQQRAVGTTL